MEKKKDILRLKWFLNWLTRKRLPGWCLAGWLLVYPMAGNTQPRMLVLGDSHMVGQFGERFHLKLHQFNRFEILSVAIGGSGSANFLNTLTNFCCGFMVRQARPGDSLDKNGRFPFLAGTYVITNERILENYYSRLDSILKIYKPHVVVIELGSNLINAHQQLLRLIHTYVPNAPVYWIGPYARAFAGYRIQEIEKVCYPLYNRCSLVRCDDVIGNESLITAHFTGEQALLWADSVVNRLNRTYVVHQRHALAYNISMSYSLLASRLCCPFMVPCIRKIMQFSPGEGWLANGMFSGMTANVK